MKVIADLEVHSKYARAVSSQMTLPNIAIWSKKKGIDLVGTGDFTHPMWFREIQANLEEAAEGIYTLRGKQEKVRFLLTSEVSSIFSQNGRGYRIHTIIFAPNVETAGKINQELARRGCNLLADGRPIIGLSCRQLAEVVFSIDPNCLLIPAHVWTPWFGFYGANGGFDSLEDGFGEYAKYIYAVETGMSSDPAMNWRIAELEKRSIVSFGDAHSLPKLGREATVFEIEELSYEMIRQAIVGPVGSSSRPTSSEGVPAVTRRDALRSRHPQIAYTIEFYPEEGKYHLTGHRACGVKHTPGQTQKLGTVCPICGKRLTVGVMHRVVELEDRMSEVSVQMTKDDNGVRWVRHEGDSCPPYVMLVPLLEILSEVVGAGVSSQKVLNEYEMLTAGFGSEFSVLLKAKADEIERVGGQRLREGIMKVRGGDISIDPGFDGVFGKVKIWPLAGARDKPGVEKPRQEGLF